MVLYNKLKQKLCIQTKITNEEPIKKNVLLMQTEREGRRNEKKKKKKNPNPKQNKKTTYLPLPI